MPKGVMQRMTHNSFSSSEITLYAPIYATVNGFTCAYVIDSFSSVCVCACVYRCTLLLVGIDSCLCGGM